MASANPFPGPRVPRLGGAPEPQPVRPGSPPLAPPPQARLSPPALAPCSSGPGLASQAICVIRGGPYRPQLPLTLRSNGVLVRRWRREGGVEEEPVCGGEAVQWEDQAGSGAPACPMAGTWARRHGA